MRKRWTRWEERLRRSAARLLAACLSLSVPAAAGAAPTELRIARIAGPGLELQAIAAQLQPDAEGASLGIQIARVEAAGERIRSLSWTCRLEAPPAPPACNGPLRWQGGPAGRLRLVNDAGWRADWRSGETRVELEADAALQALDLVWRQLPLDWLAPWLVDTLPSGVAVTGGLVGGRASADLARGEWQIEASMVEGALDSADGLTAAAGVTARARFRVSESPQAGIEAELNIEGGELLYQQLYVPLLGGSRLQLALEETGAGWSLAGPLRFSDPEGAQVELALMDGEAWQLELGLPELSRSGPRYLDGPLAALGFGGAAFAGSLDARLSGQGERLESLSIEAVDLTFADAQGVLVISGLSGPLSWRAQGPADPTALSWRTLSLQGVGLGPAALNGKVEAGVFVASAPLRFAPFGGRLEVFPLSIEPLAASAEFEARMDSINLAALSAQFGWPAFEGSLSGALPAATYRNDLFSSDGELDIGVFGGQVRIGALRWERPFSSSPSIAADILLDGLDLDPLTSAFGFGAITGRLDGHIRGLRMLEGSPVAFDAFLYTDDEWKGRRRISQRAVNDIGSVGGGVAAGLQQTVLSVFDTFGYRRIGLRCRLANNVCEMGGVEDLGNGYVLIEGAGLPRVSVNGYRRRVDWPVLLSRLQAAASGGGISVD